MVGNVFIINVLIMKSLEAVGDVAAWHFCSVPVTRVTRQNQLLPKCCHGLAKVAMSCLIAGGHKNGTEHQASISEHPHFIHYNGHDDIAETSLLRASLGPTTIVLELK